MNNFCVSAETKEVNYHVRQVNRDGSILIIKIDRETINNPDPEALGRILYCSTEIVIKFTEKPELPTEGKKATIAFKSENGLKISVIVIRKTAAKQLKKVDDYVDWIGAISGKIHKIEDGTIFVGEAGLQVFEKKPKEEKANSQ